MADTWTPISGYTPQDYTDTAVFEVNSETKKIALITGQALVAGEENSQYIKFVLDRYWDGIDIKDKAFYVEYALAGQYYGKTSAVNAEYNTEQIRFGWVVPKEACCISGTLLFILRIESEDYVLKTQIAEHPVFKSVNVEDVVPEPTKEEWYREFEARVDNAISEAENAISAAQTAQVGAEIAAQNAQTAEANAEAAAAIAQIRYGSPLVAHTAEEMAEQNRVYVFTGSETGYTAGHWYYYNGTEWADGGVYNAVEVDIDATLSIARKAADAKATGDAINELKSGIRDLQDGGYVADAQKIQEKIDKYLDEHPEATTTVQDGSLDYKKLVTGTLGFVTPQMFGAKGDGQTDDTDAILSAILYSSQHDAVTVLRGNYRITEPIEISDDVVLDLCGSSIDFSGEQCFNITGNRPTVTIYGGQIRGNGTNTGLAFSNALRCSVIGTKIYDVMYAVNTRLLGQYGGGHHFINVTAQNSSFIPGSIAFLDSGNDNSFINCIVQDFHVATRTRTGKYYNLHAWVSQPSFYTGSVFAQINGMSSAFTDCVCDSIQFGFYEYADKVHCNISNFTMMRNDKVATDELIAEHPCRVVYNTSKLFPSISGIVTEFECRLYEHSPSQITDVQPTGIGTPNLFSNKPTAYTFTDTSNGVSYYRFGNVCVMTIHGLSAQTLSEGSKILDLPNGFNPVGRTEFLDTYSQKRLFLATTTRGGYLGTQTALTNATLRGSVVFICQ